MTDEKDPLSPETLRELASMGIAVTGKYLRNVADALEQAIAHDRQPYPTADAYEKACAALHQCECKLGSMELALAAETTRANLFASRLGRVAALADTALTTLGGDDFVVLGEAIRQIHALVVERQENNK